jgi:predicted small lipoprotein YifL
MKIRAVHMTIVLIGVVGCGQKGPLYLPEHNGAVVTRPGAGPQDIGADQPAGQRPAATSGASTPTPATTAPASSAPAPAPAGTTKKGTGQDEDSSH